MKTKILRFTIFSTLSFFSGCSYLSPTLNSESYAPEYKEHLVYTIDNHRYITIYGTNHCMGTIYYYDTSLNIRKSVSVTGETLGTGIFQGYYAIDSQYIAIPSIIFSEMSGPLLYIYYSRDQGRTFKYFLGAAEGDESQVIILKENNLFIADRDSDNSKNFTWAYRYDLSSELRIDDSQQIPPEQEQRVSSGTVPLETTSPSKSTRWVCGAPF